MQRTWVQSILIPAVLLSAAWPLLAQAAPTAYPRMEPVNEYLMADQAAEIAMARSAGPKAISDHAEILVMGRHDYATAVKGTNGFVCMVERSWTALPNDPDFWNSKLRGPLCLNPGAVRSYLPMTRLKTQLVLAGKSKAEMLQAVKAAYDQKRLPAIEPGAMSYMLSKQGYLADADGHWHPHLMFFVAPTDEKLLGANLPGSPVIAAQDPDDRMTIILVPVARWSDGSLDTDTKN